MEHHLSVARTARYQQLGEPSAATRQLWLVAHGYGQLAEYFMRHFKSVHALDPAGTVIVAPEALSRFYISGTSGRVGASWMTSADRLTEIADLGTYLDTLLGHLPAQCTRDRAGFFAGHRHGKPLASGQCWALAPHRLILWAGDFPTDIEAAAAQQLLQDLPLVLVSGELDGYAGPEKLQAQAEALGTYGAQITTRSFAGNHTLYPPLRRFTRLQNKLSPKRLSE